MATTTTLRTIPVDRIRRDADQPRKLFNQAELEALASSMKELGQLQAVTVRYMPATHDYILIMGERRWRAAQIAGITELHAMVQQGVDDEEAYLKAVTENIGRVDMTPLEEAEAFAKLVAAGYTVEQIAARVGRSVDGVGYRLDLLQLTPACRDALAKGHLPLGLAWYVSKLEPNAQQVLLAKWGRGEFAGPRDAEAFAQACRLKADQQGMFGAAELFGMAEPSAEEKERIQGKRRTVTSKVERLGAAGQILFDLSQETPEELALVLQGARGGVDAYLAQIDALRAAASKAAAKLRKAQALVRASTLDFDMPAADEATAA